METGSFPSVIKAAVVCDYALTADDGKLSVLGIFSNIGFPSLPNVYPRFFIVIIATLDVGTHSVRLSMVDPMGNQILPEPPNVEVQVDTPGMDTNLMVDFNNLPFAVAGVHQVQLYVDGRILHTIPLHVQAIESEVGAGRAN